MERLTIPDTPIEGGIRRAVIDTRAVKEQAMTIYWALKKYEDTGLTPEEIMDERLLTGWIPVEEQLPPEPEDGMVDYDDLEEYIVMIDGAHRPTFLAYAGDGEWYEDGEFYRVCAWMPLPKPYKQEI